MPPSPEVLYPGLPGHPGHAIAARQMQGGFGGMLSIRLRGGEAAAIATAARTMLWKRATSLGGVESLIEHRGSIEGPGSPCPLDLLRLSAGIEDVEDLYADLDQALRAADDSSPPPLEGGGREADPGWRRGSASTPSDILVRFAAQALKGRGR